MPYILSPMPNILEVFDKVFFIFNTMELFSENLQALILAEPTRENPVLAP